MEVFVGEAKPGEWRDGTTDAVPRGPRFATHAARRGARHANANLNVKGFAVYQVAQATSDMPIG